jgi:hypothetical protein
MIRESNSESRNLFSCRNSNDYVFGTRRLVSKNPPATGSNVLEWKGKISVKTDGGRKERGDKSTGLLKKFEIVCFQMFCLKIDTTVVDRDSRSVPKSRT